MSGLEMEAKDLEFAIDMASDSESVDCFWDLLSKEANASLVQELERMRKMYIEHLADEHFEVEELNEAEEEFHGDKYKKVLVFLLAGLYSMSENVVPRRLHSDLIDDVRRAYGIEEAIRWHETRLASFGDVYEEFVAEIMRISIRENVCPRIEGSGFLYGLGIAWIMAMKEDNPKLKIPERKKQLERTSRMSTPIINSPEIGKRLMAEIEATLEGFGVDTEPDSL